MYRKIYIYKMVKISDDFFSKYGFLDMRSFDVELAGKRDNARGTFLFQIDTSYKVHFISIHSHMLWLFMKTIEKTV
jgi:hypothetical protein